jgi:hypothetical protein
MSSFEISVQPGILPEKARPPQLRGSPTGGTLLLLLTPPTGATETGRSAVIMYTVFRNDGREDL